VAASEVEDLISRAINLIEATALGKEIAYGPHGGSRIANDL
jgi:hypothetical protein